MRNGKEALGSSLAVSLVWVFQSMTLLEHCWLGLKDAHSGAHKEACIRGILYPVPNRNEMECSGRRWGHDPTPRGLSGQGLILYLARLRPPPRYSHGSDMRLCTMLGDLSRTHMLVGFTICMGPRRCWWRGHPLLESFNAMTRAHGHGNTCKH